MSWPQQERCRFLAGSYTVTRGSTLVGAKVWVWGLRGEELTEAVRKKGQ